MAKSKDKEIVAEIAEALAEQNGSSNSHTPDENPVNPQKSERDNSSPEYPDGKLPKKKNSAVKDKPTYKDLALAKKSQNLAERKVLLVIMAVLLGIQLLFMNVIVLLIVLWCVFDHEHFRELDSTVLTCIFDFSKYYVTAVLVELLGGIVYIVHSVFNEKD